MRARFVLARRSASGGDAWHAWGVNQRPDVEALRATGDVAALSEALKHPDDVVADRAARALGDLRAAEAIPALAEVVRAGRGRGPVWALTQIDDPRLAAPLIVALGNADPTARALAAGKLADLGAREAVPALLDVLRNDRDQHVREEAARALGMLGDRAAVDPLLMALRADRGAHVREEAATALGRLGDLSAKAPLLSARRDRHVAVQRAAEGALRVLGAVEG
jgi:HEAT repeat protein